MRKNNKLRILTGVAAVVLGLSAYADQYKSGQGDKDDRGDKAVETCFTGFDGTVHYQFSIKKHLPSSDGAFPLQGRVFGALVSCAGLAQWPVMGTVVVDGEQLILAFRAMTVDAATCGAIDYIVHLDSATLSGPLQLYNNRKDFSNESTLIPATCTSPATTVGPVQRSIGVDSQGNPAS